MTPKKRKYAEARMAGNTKKESAVIAGCPESTASQQASRLEKDKDVIGIWSRAGWVKDSDTVIETAVIAVAAAPTVVARANIRAEEKEYDDPLAFMQSIMNDPGEDPKMRLDAAKALAMYTKQKPGESGKKEQKDKAAGKVSRGRFSPAPPPLSVVKK